MAIYPDVNGVRYDYSSIEIQLPTGTITGVKAISWSNKLEPGKVRGTSAQVNGRTRGQYEVDASVTLYRAEADELRASLGDGYMERAFPIVVHFADDGQPVSTAELLGCRIKSESEEQEEGSDALVTKFELDVLAIKRNGISPLRRMNF